MSSLPEASRHIQPNSSACRLTERQSPLFEVPGIVADSSPTVGMGKTFTIPRSRRAEQVADGLGNSVDSERIAALRVRRGTGRCTRYRAAWEPRAIDQLIDRIAEPGDACRGDPAGALPGSDRRPAAAGPPAGALDPDVAAAPPRLRRRSRRPRSGSSTRRARCAASSRSAAARGRMRNGRRGGRPPRRRAASKGAATAAPVRRWQHVAGVVAVLPRGHAQRRRCTWGRRPGCSGSALERESLLGRGTARERSLVAAGERRLARLGYDLHDGPAPGRRRRAPRAVLLRDELARRLGPRDEDDAPGPARPARGDGLGQRASGCASSPSPPSRRRSSARPFRAPLEAEITSFVAASDVEADVDLSGDLDSLTGSQRIALAAHRPGGAEQRPRAQRRHPRPHLRRPRQRLRPRRDRGRRPRLRARAHAGARGEARPHGPRRDERARAAAGRRVRRPQRARRPDPDLRDSARVAAARGRRRPALRRARALGLTRPPTAMEEH